jgi:hypothetical protein
MNRLVVAASCAVLTGVLFGCGGGSGDSSSASSDRPAEKFAQGDGAKGEAANDDYNYIHAHLGTHGFVGELVYCFASPLPHDKSSHNDVDWAEEGVRTGYCFGEFHAGSSPFDDGLEGDSTWQYLGGGASPLGASAPNEKLIRITSYLRDDKRPSSRKGIECFITTRNSNACLTNGDQQGRPPNTQGGPLQIQVQARGNSYVYILIRGWCRNGDERCTPHQIDF